MTNEMKPKDFVTRLKMKMKTNFRRLIYSDGVTPLPGKIMALIYLMMISNAMTMTVVFSFLPKMVKAFGASELSAGYLAGFIASALFMARIFVSVLWGYLSDTIGKKKTFLMSAIGLTTATLLFGFSTSYYWALVTRFLQGGFMGLIVVAKTIVADVCDDTNISIGMAFIISAYSVGLILGPSLSGFLVFPAEQYPESFSEGGFFGIFPILLPLLVIVVGFVVSITLSILYLPPDKKRNGVGEYAHLIPHPRHNKTYNGEGSSAACIVNSEDYTNISLECDSVTDAKGRWMGMEMFQIAEPYVEMKSPRKFTCCSFSAFKDSKMYRIFKTRACNISFALYGMFSFVAVGYSECSSLFMATAIEYNGFGFTTSQIGTALLVASAFLLVVQMTILPRVNDYFGSKKNLILCTLGLGLFFPLLPCVIVVIENRYAFWFLLALVLLVTRVLITSSYLAINILVNNSVTPDLLGSVNGIAMTCASVFRMLSPTVLGGIYSWSLTNVEGLDKLYEALGFPFNQFFVFYVMSFISVIIAFLTSMLPDSMDVKKKTPVKAMPSYSRSQSETSSSSEHGDTATEPKNKRTVSSKGKVKNDKDWKKTTITISTWKSET